MSNDHRNLTRRIVHILHEFSTVDFWESNTFYSIILLTYLCFRQTLYMPLRQWIYAEDVGYLTIGWKWQEHDLTIGSKCVMNQKIWRRVWYIFYMIFQRFFLLLIERFQSTGGSGSLAFLPYGILAATHTIVFHFERIRINYPPLHRFRMSGLFLNYQTWCRES